MVDIYYHMLLTLKTASNIIVMLPSEIRKVILLLQNIKISDTK